MVPEEQLVENEEGSVHNEDGSTDAGSSLRNENRGERNESTRPSVDDEIGDDGNGSDNDDPHHEDPGKAEALPVQKERVESEPGSREISDDSEHSGADSAESRVTGSYEVQSSASSSDQSRSASTSRRIAKSHITSVGTSGETAVSGEGEYETEARIATKTSGSDTGSTDKESLDSDQDRSSEAEEESPAHPEDVASPTNLSPVQDVDAEGQAVASVEPSQLVMPTEVTISSPNVLYSPPDPVPEAEQAAESTSEVPKQDRAAVNVSSTSAEEGASSSEERRRNDSEDDRESCREPSVRHGAQRHSSSSLVNARGTVGPCIAASNIETSSLSGSSVQLVQETECIRPSQELEQTSETPRSTDEVRQNATGLGVKNSISLTLQEAFAKTRDKMNKGIRDDAESDLAKYIADQVQSFIDEKKAEAQATSCPQNPDAPNSSPSTEGPFKVPKPKNADNKQSKIKQRKELPPLKPVPEVSEVFLDTPPESQHTSEHTDEDMNKIKQRQALSSRPQTIATRPKRGRYVRFRTSPRSACHSPLTKTCPSLKLRTKAVKRRADRRLSLALQEQSREFSSSSSRSCSRSRHDLRQSHSGAQRRGNKRRKLVENNPTTDSGRQEVDADETSETIGNASQPDASGEEQSTSSVEAEASVVQVQRPRASSNNESNSVESLPAPSNKLESSAPVNSWETTGARPRTSRTRHRRRLATRLTRAPNVPANTKTNSVKQNRERDPRENDKEYTEALEALRVSLVRVLNIGPNMTVPRNGPAQQQVSLNQSAGSTSRDEQESEGILNIVSNQRPPSTEETRTITEIVHRSDGTSRYLVVNGAEDPLDEFFVLSRRRRHLTGVDPIHRHRNERLTSVSQALSPIQELRAEAEVEEVTEDNAGSTIVTSGNLTTIMGVCIFVLVLGTCVWRVRARF